MSDWEKNAEIQLFQEYLRIPSVQPNIDYTACIEFLKKQAASLQLPFDVFYPKVETKPVVILTWLGKEPTLPAVVLNSHMDVVPVFPEKWTYPPFSAHINEEGKIYARGAQDMKSVGIQYLAAVRKLKAAGYQPKRTIYLTYVPDEEIGGVAGMLDFVHTDYFKKLNIGFSLDEGIPSADDTFFVYYAERSLWHLRLKITGNAGHGSLLLKNTAGEKLHYIVDKMMTFRAGEVKRLDENPDFDIGDVTTVNLTQVSGGVQSNVIPPVMEVTFDVRFAIDRDIDAFEQQIRKWAEEAGGGIELIFELKNPKVEPTKIDATNPYWINFKKAIDELGLSIRTRVFPGATDSRFIRKVGIPALGFSPMNNTPMLLHDHNEFIHADVFLRGIDIYQKLIPALADA